MDQLLMKSDVVLFGCDKHGTIILQEGGGLLRYNLKSKQYLGMNVYDVFIEIPDFVKAVIEILKGQNLENVSLMYNNTHLTVDDEGIIIGVTTPSSKSNSHMSKSKELISYVVHEIRSPLSGIISLLDCIIENNMSANSNNLMIIKNTGDQILHLVNDLLDISKIDKGKMVIENISFNLLNIVTDIKIFYEKVAINKNIKIKCDVLVNKYAFGDPHRIRQILNNFISNALKFSNNGDTVIIGYLIDDDYVLFYVKDSGIGISQLNQESLFNDYFQTDPSISRKFGGTGLGLSICKKLVDAMNGEIGCTSDINKGSYFWFKLPLKV